MKMKLLTALTLSSLVLAACQDNPTPNEVEETLDDEVAEVEPEEKEEPEEPAEKEIEEEEEVVEFQ